MADSLGDILGKSPLVEPPEVRVIKDFVVKNFNSAVSVVVAKNTLTIVTDNAPLAGALRMHLHKLAVLCKTDKKLLIRIG